MSTLRNRIGFTLIEIMLVVLIIATLLAIAIPNFLRARETSRARTCQSNLHGIVTAKEQWAMNNRKSLSDTATPIDLVTEYIKNSNENKLPNCPSSGSYSINDLATNPTCTIGTNEFAEDWDDHRLFQ